MITKTTFFEGWSWLKFNNLGLALGVTLTFYTSVAKRAKTKTQKVFWAKPYVCRSYRGKTVREAIPPLILNRVKKEIPSHHEQGEAPVEFVSIVEEHYHQNFYSAEILL